MPQMGEPEMTTPNWKQHKYPRGSRVRGVLLADSTIEFNGELLTDYDINRTDNEMPKIQLDNGEVVRGSECWWIPIDELCEITRTNAAAPITMTCTSKVLK